MEDLTNLCRFVFSVFLFKYSEGIFVRGTAGELMQRQGYVEAVTLLIRSAAAVPSIFMDTFVATTLAEREEDSHFPGTMFCQYLIH